MQHVVMLLKPYDETKGQYVPVRVASADLRSICNLGGQKWLPAMRRLPRVAYRIFGGEFGASGSGASSTRFTLNLDMIKRHWPDADKGDWSGARVTMWTGKQGEEWPWRRLMCARVDSYSRENNALSINASVDTEPFDLTFPTATYAGTTGIEGPVDIKGTVKPLALGHPKNVEPVFIDTVNNVYQFSAYGPIEGIDGLFERASDFGPAAADYPDYTALVAATIEPGQWASCLAEGLVRLGAPAAGVITGDLRGHAVDGVAPRLPGQIIRALASIAGLDEALLDRTSLDQMDVSAPYNCETVLTSAESLIDVAVRIAASVNHVAGVWLDGRLFAQSISISDAASVLFHSEGRALPLVKRVRESSTSTPYSKVQLGAQRNWRVQTAEEIASDVAIVDTGAFSATRTYRAGEIAQLTDGRKFKYINDTPSAGNVPPNTTYWEPFTPALTYEDGTPIEVLRPAEPDADVTSNQQITFNDPHALVVQADTAGVTTTDLTQLSSTIMVYKGGVLQTTGVTVGSVVGNPQTAITGTAVVNAGLVTIALTKADAAGTVTVPITIGGVTYQRTVDVNRNVASPPSGGGAGGSSFTDGVWSSVSTDTFEQVTDVGAIVQSKDNGGDGEIQFLFNATYEGNTSIVARAQISTDGTNWTDVGLADTVGDPPNQLPGEEQSGFLFQVSFIETGLTPNTDYFVRLRARRLSGSGIVSFGLPTFTARQP